MVNKPSFAFFEFTIKLELNSKFEGFYGI
jgi:hypothetical protein